MIFLCVFHCFYKGLWRVLDFNFLSQVLNHIIQLCEENDWLSTGIPLEECVETLGQLFPKYKNCFTFDLMYANFIDKKACQTSLKSKCFMGCLFFYVTLKNISFIWRRNHCRWKAYAWHLQPLKREGSLLYLGACIFVSSAEGHNGIKWMKASGGTKYYI